MIIDGYGAEDINNNAMKNMNQYILKRNSELIDRKVIEDIKAEIQKALDEDKATDTENAKVQAIALMWCLEVIDKHIGDTV